MKHKVEQTLMFLVIAALLMTLLGIGLSSMVIGETGFITAIVLVFPLCIAMSFEEEGFDD